MVVGWLGKNGSRTNHLSHLLKNLVIRQPFFCLRRVDEDDHDGLSSLQQASLLTKSKRRGDSSSLPESDGHDEDCFDKGYSWGRGELEREVVAEEIDERLEGMVRNWGWGSVATFEERMKGCRDLVRLILAISSDSDELP